MGAAHGKDIVILDCTIW